jgi:hypothetical protein
MLNGAKKAGMGLEPKVPGVVEQDGQRGRRVEECNKEGDSVEGKLGQATALWLKVQDQIGQVMSVQRLMRHIARQQTWIDKSKEQERDASVAPRIVEGQRVKIVGLATDRALNGCFATVMRLLHNDDTGRAVIKMEDTARKKAGVRGGEKINISVGHLKRLDAMQPQAMRHLEQEEKDNLLERQLRPLCLHAGALLVQLGCHSQAACIFEIGREHGKAADQLRLVKSFRPVAWVRNQLLHIVPQALTQSRGAAGVEGAWGDGLDRHGQGPRDTNIGELRALCQDVEEARSIVNAHRRADTARSSAVVYESDLKALAEIENLSKQGIVSKMRCNSEREGVRERGRGRSVGRAGRESHNGIVTVTEGSSASLTTVQRGHSVSVASLASKYSKSTFASVFSHTTAGTLCVVCLSPLNRSSNVALPVDTHAYVRSVTLHMIALAHTFMMVVASKRSNCASLFFDQPPSDPGYWCLTGVSHGERLLRKNASDKHV